MILRFVRIIKNSIKLDIYDLNYVYSNPAILERFFSSNSVSLPRRGIFIRILSYIGHLIKNFNPFSWQKQASIEKESILFYVNSENQKYSLEPLSNHLDNVIMFGNHVEYPFTLSTFLAYIFSVPFFPIVLIKFLRSDGIIKGGYYYNFNLYWLTYGFYISVRSWFQYVRPKAIVLANDHIMQHRVMAKAAKDEGIPSIYIQHASVSSQLPPLNFDYALLEGRDSLTIYDTNGSLDTTVFLIGIPKFDKHIDQINNRQTIKSIGVCTNWLEPLDRAEELCSELKDELPGYKLILRPHPRDKRFESWRRIAIKHNLTLSNSKKEGVYEFLHQVDLILAGNSNIHLEAALVNVFPIYYDFTLNPIFEIYSFIRNGLCEYISKPQEASQRILSLSMNRPNIRNRTKYYCNTVGSVFDGHSSVLASKLINQIASQEILSLENWTQINGFNLDAFEPSLNGNLLI